MAVLTVTMTTDNAAFTENDRPGEEVWRILSQLGRRLEDAGPGGNGPRPILDINGNIVGSWEWTK